jgi:hypothetical protein
VEQGDEGDDGSFADAHQVVWSVRAACAAFLRPYY